MTPLEKKYDDFEAALEEEIHRGLRDQFARRYRMHQYPTGLILLESINDKYPLVFTADLLKPNEIQRVLTALKEPNPLRRFLSARNIGVNTMAEGMNRAVSKQLIFELSTGATDLSYTSQEILYENIGIRYNPIDLRRGDVFDVEKF